MALRVLAVRGCFGAWPRTASSSTFFAARATGTQQGAEHGSTFNNDDGTDKHSDRAIASGSAGSKQRATDSASAGDAEQRAIVLPMPKLSHTMTHGRIKKWHIAEGSPIGMYDVLLTVETETLVEEAYRIDQFAGKVDLLVESQEEGFTARLLAVEGEEVAVGKPIALLCEHAGDVTAVRDNADWFDRVHDVYNSTSTPRLRLLEWQSYLARGPPSSGCL